ncbi:MAG: DUF5320 domain-containing protein [Sedimentisphaerales bacterium]|nr:DUF5320 domain-containing protein [Sedimentisphaerales bacterium]
MPGFDGTGPLGQGPITGRGQGFCVLTSSVENPARVKGFAGLQGVPVGQELENLEDTGKEVINMPYGDGTGPAGAGPMTGRAAGFCAGYPLPGYANPVLGRAGFYGVGAPAFGPYGMPYVGWIRPSIGRGLGFGQGFARGRGRGRGRGGFGYWR